MDQNDRKAQKPVKIRFFAQFEAEIDKFKPSASMVSEECIVQMDVCKTIECTLIKTAIYFIQQHPALAWYRDIHWVDYNDEYVPESAAKKRYGLYLKALETVCWEENKMKIYYRDIVKHLLTALYELPECGCGGIAHIVTDDLNTRDNDLDFVLKQCETEPNRIEVPLVRCLMEYLKRFDRTERSDLIHEWWTKGELR